MVTHRIYRKALVSIECLLDAVGGYKTVAGMIERSLREDAASEHLVIIGPISVRFALPAFDSHWFFEEYVIVTAVARAIKFTPIPQE